MATAAPMILAGTDKSLTKVINGQTYVRQYNANDGKYYFVAQGLRIEPPAPTTWEKIANALSFGNLTSPSYVNVPPNTPLTTNKNQLADALGGKGLGLDSNGNLITEKGTQVEGTQGRGTTVVSGGGGTTGGGGTSGGGGAPKTNVNTSLTGLIGQTSTANLNMADFEAQSLAMLTPYYDRLLKEAKFDIDRAKARLEEDYVTGARKVNIAKDVEQSSEATTSKSELLSALDELNKRGLLQTMAETPTYSRSAMVQSTGETVPDYEPTSAKFGGLAGSRLQDLYKGQQARREAIDRARKTGIEDYMTIKTRGLEDATTTGERKLYNLGQAKTQAIRPLATNLYNQKASELGLQQKETMAPYLDYKF